MKRERSNDCVWYFFLTVSCVLLLSAADAVGQVDKIPPASPAPVSTNTYETGTGSAVPQDIEGFDATSANLRKQIGNLKARIQELEGNIAAHEERIKSFEKANYIWNDLLETKQEITRLRAESGINVSSATYQEQLMKEMDGYFARDVRAIEVSEDKAINSYQELGDYIKANQPEFKKSRETIKQLKKELELSNEELEVSQEELARLEKNVTVDKAQSRLLGKWSPQINESVVEVRFNERDKSFTGRLVVNNFRCYKDSDEVFTVVLINEEDPNRFSGRKHFYDDNCNERYSNLWITVKGDELLFLSRGKTETWYRVHD